MRVLIADDSHHMVERLVALMEAEKGVEIVGRACTAAEASEAIRELKPDVVVLDLCMPGGSGMDVLRQLKKESGSTPVIIVLTAYGESQYRKRCLEGGASYFLDKSTEFERLAEVLRGLRNDGSVEPDKAHLGTHATPPPSASPSPSAEASGARKPRLIVSNSNKGEPVFYVCSVCLRGFPLPDIRPPMQAVRQLYATFREHVEQEHVAPSESRLVDKAS